MTHIGVDYGRKRTGLAVYLHGVVLPLDPVTGGQKELTKRLHELSGTYGNCRFIIGLPLSALGKPTELSIEVEKFKEDLIDAGFQVKMVNEAGSSKEAARLVGKKDRKGRSDSVAACEILKRYLGIL